MPKALGSSPVSSASVCRQAKNKHIYEVSSSITFDITCRHIFN